MNLSSKNYIFVKIFLCLLVIGWIVYLNISNNNLNFYSSETFSKALARLKILEEKSGNSIETELSDETFAPRLRAKDEKNLSYILYWRHDWGVGTEGWVAGVDLGGCAVTYDRSKIKDAEAVVFHYSALDHESMPWQHYRDEDQIFVYFNHESPSYMKWGERRNDFSKFDNGFINLTTSHRSDSSIFYPYSSDLKSILDRGKTWVDERMAEKSNSNVALWIVSNCDFLYGSVTRLKISDELFKAGLPVHRYGTCFSNKHVINNMDPKTLNSYKFYLAFENSFHCKDYTTEKFWIKSIQSGRVPVVWGPSKDDVTRLAPTKSFIHYEDFDSPSSLVSYLLYLNGNDTAYREYFKWAEDPDQRTKDLVEWRRSGQIKLCEYIKNRERNKSVVKSITNFFLNESSECFRRKS